MTLAWLSVTRSTRSLASYGYGKKCIVFNLGVFGSHCMDRAATDLINHIPLGEYEFVLNHRPEQSSPFDRRPADVAIEYDISPQKADHVIQAPVIGEVHCA